MNWTNWWKWKNSLYKIYPYSYSDELINIYVTVEEEVYTRIGQLGRRDCLKYWQPASSRGLYCSFYVIWSVTTQIPGCQQNQPVQSSLFASTEEEFTQFFWYLQFYFHIQISLVSHCLLSSDLFTTVFIFREIALIQ